MFRKIIASLKSRLIDTSSLGYFKKLAQKSSERQALLGQYSRAILTEGYNGKLLIRTTDMVVGFHLANEGCYDREVVEYHLSYLTHQSKVLIVGTHVGSLLIPLARRVAQVVGIEANQDTFELLQMNLLLNGLKNVTVYNYAAGNENKSVSFIMNTHNTGGSKIKMGVASQEGPSIYTYDNPRICSVEMRRLDEVVAAKAFDLIIMDVEGAECLALEGMAEILANSPKLQIEVAPHAISDIANKTPAQFSAQLARFYTRISVLPTADAEGMDFPKHDIPAAIEAICRTGKTIDVILEK